MELGGHSSFQISERGQGPLPPGPLGPGSLRSLFMDLFGRPPLAEERGKWSGRSRSELVGWALHVEEFWRNWLDEQLYFFLLIDNFRPDHREASRRSPANSPEVPSERSRPCTGFASPPASTDGNPGPDTFVTVVMEQLLGIEVQRNPRELEIGKKVYDGARGRSWAVRAAPRPMSCTSPSRITALLATSSGGEYERLLRRQPREQELDAWVTTLEQDPFALPSILQGWFLSSPYDASPRVPSSAPQPAVHSRPVRRSPRSGSRPRGGRALARGARWSRELRAPAITRRSPHPRLRRVVFPSAKTSGDARAWTQELFGAPRSGDRPHLPNSTFAECFADPACRPATILSTLSCPILSIRLGESI